MNRYVSLIYFLLIGVISAENTFASEDILSVDRTLIVQIIIFVSSIFLLNKLLFKPLLDLDLRRDKLTTGTTTEARELRAKAEETINEYRNRINEARMQLQEERNEVRKNAQASATEIVSSAREEVNDMLDEARVNIDKESKDLREKIKPEIELIAKNVASQFLNKEI